MECVVRVIGDYGEDPIIAHTDETGLPISMAESGLGVWVPYQVAPPPAAWVRVAVINFDGDTCDEERRIRAVSRGAGR